MEDITETEDMSERIAKAAYAELDAERKKKENPDVEIVEQTEEISEPEIEIEVDEPAKKETPEPEKKLTQEGDPPNPDQELAADVRAYMEKHEVSEEDARAEVQHIYKQLEQYNKDPKQLAKALLNAQRGYSKLEQQVKQRSEQKPTEVSAKAIKDRIESGEWHIPTGQKTANGHDVVKVLTKQELISAYCKANPELSEELEDDKIFDLACRDITNRMNESVRQQSATLPERAKLRRTELLAKVKEAVPDHMAEELKKTIEELGDEDILNSDFDITHAATFVKGVHYDKAIKKAEKDGYDRGLKEGKEKAEIVTPPTTTGKTATGTVKVKMTQPQKERAEQMFSDYISSGRWTKEKAYREYIDIHKDEFPQLKKEKK